MLALTLFYCSALPAVDLTGLYRADVAVAGRDEAARAQAFRRGLEQVLRRVVRTEDLGSAAMRTVLAKPEACVLQFEYTGGYRDGNPVLSVDFDPDRVRQLLHKQGIDVWGSERPEVLAWISLEDSQPPRILNPEAMPDLDRLLQELAADAGLPLILPLGDLEDEQSLNPGDIATGNVGRILGASARYETPAILAGRLTRKAGGGFQADWRLYRGQREEVWQIQAGDLRGALNSGLAGVHARLAGQLIPPRTGGTASLELRVVGIASLDDSNRVAAYLGKLTPVTKVELLSVGAEDASFRLGVRGGRAMLEDTLAAGKLLRPATDEAIEPDAPRLTYRLAP